MFVHILVALAVIAALVAIVTFVLYCRARMKEQEREKLFLTVHYISLFLLLLTGVAYMIFMVATET